MNPHGGGDLGAAPGELERRRAAEAIADGGDTRAIDSRLRAQNVESLRQPGADGERVFEELLQTPAHLRAVGHKLAVPVIIEPKGRVAGLGQPPHHAFRVLAEPRPRRGDEDAGPAPARAGSAVGGEVAQQGYTVRLITDLSRRLIHARRPPATAAIR